MERKVDEAKSSANSSASSSSHGSLVRSETFVIESSSLSVTSEEAPSKLYFASNEETDAPVGSDSSGTATLREKSVEDGLDCTNLSPVISERLTSLLRNYQASSDELSLSSDIIDEQVNNLKDMRKMLEEYHRLQWENLRLRQNRERHTLQVQINCMQALREKVSNERKAENDRSSPKNFVDIAPSKQLKPRPRLSSEGKCFKYNRVEYKTPPWHGHQANIAMSEALKCKVIAHVKGYLTRRLLRTALVAQLKKGIVELRKQLNILEDNSKLSDQELHYKMEVLHQVDCLLNDVHRIFFILSMKKRMHIIAQDRETMLRCKTGQRLEVKGKGLNKGNSYESTCSTNQSRSSAGPCRCEKCKRTTANVACQTQFALSNIPNVESPEALKNVVRRRISVNANLATPKEQRSLKNKRTGPQQYCAKHQPWR